MNIFNKTFQYILIKVWASVWYPIVLTNLNMCRFNFDSGKRMGSLAEDIVFSRDQDKTWSPKGLHHISTKKTEIRFFGEPVCVRNPHNDGSDLRSKRLLLFFDSELSSCQIFGKICAAALQETSYPTVAICWLIATSVFPIRIPRTSKSSTSCYSVMVRV